MEHVRRLTALIEREDGDEGESGHVAICPEVDIASQGSTIEETRTSLIEALTFVLRIG